MTTYIVSNTGEDAIFTLSSGDTMVVLSGGTSEDNSVSSGGRLIVSSGGASEGDTVFAGGLETLLSGAIGSGLTVSSGGTLTGAGVVLGVTTDLGLISGVTISSAAGPSFGSMMVGLHGIASGVTVADSFAYILSGGAARNLTAISGGLVVVSAGGTATGTFLLSGSDDVHGVGHGTVVELGAETVLAGGSAVGTVVSNGGSQSISSGGVASGAAIFNGGSQVVSTGGRAAGTSIASGGVETITIGGVAQSSLVGSGGSELIQSGGVASGFAISSGGFLTVTSGGVLRVGTTGSSTNFGTIDVKSTAEMDLAGTLQNGGQIVYESANMVEVTAAKATLTGSGALDMLNAVLITGLAPTDVLDNESDTIEGAGQLGGNSLTVINRGVINANQATDLTLNATLITNTGLIEATNASGGLAVFGPINNSGGVIEAEGGIVQLEASTTISGGSLKESGAGAFFAEGNAELDGTAQAVTNDAVVNVADSVQLTVAGAIDNAGVISLASLGNHTDLVVDGPTVTLTGSGKVEMSDSVNNRILGDATTFTNVLDNVDDTIEGAGEIGAGKLILVNSGTVDADGSSNSLQIDTTSATNTGLMEATGSGGLLLETIVKNSGGVIAANEGNVFLEQSTQILGGVLSSTPLADIFVINTGSGAVTLNGTATPVTNTGNVGIVDQSELDLVGAIVNEGVITLSGGADFTNLVVGGTSATLTGGGVIELSDSANNRIYGAAAADKLINVDNTIEGSGEIGVGKLTLVNSGTIDATGASHPLTLDATSTVNTGVLESTTDAGLAIKSVVRNSGGVIAASDGGNVLLDPGAVISGGELLGTQFAYFFVEGVGATLSGTAASPLTVSATIYIDDDARLNLAGAIANDGIISLNAGGDLTSIVVDGPSATLTGSGALELTDSANNIITGASAADTLINVSNKIEGGGQLGDGQLTLVNSGTIDATGTGNQLVLRAVTTNTGLIESTNTAGLLIEDVIKNSGGVIAANNGAVFLEGATISGGVLSSTGSGVIRDEGAVSLDGTASQLTNRAIVDVDNGLQLVVAGAIANSGTISLSASGEDTDLVIGAAGATLTGSGAILLSDDVDNRIFGSAGADTLDNETNTIEGAGQIGANVGQLTLINRGTIDATGALASLTIDTLSATNSGLMEATGQAGLIIESVIKNAGGVIGAFGGDVFLHSGAVISGGTFSGQGGGNNLIAVQSGASVLGASIGNGAFVAVSGGAKTSGASVLSGGFEQVLSGATVSATIVKSGGVEITNSGGATSGGTVSAGGDLQGPGALRGTIVDHGVVSGGAVASGGVLNVSSGGQALGTHITSGGIETLSGGSASGAVVGSGGALKVSSGGVTSRSWVYHGGIEDVFGGGVARTTVLSGGTEYDYGATSGTQIYSGGHEVVEAHGTASAAVISSGGLLTVLSGGAISGGLKLVGGKAVISGAMAAGQWVKFAGASGVLELDNLAGFAAKISGLTDPSNKIDLGGFAFSSSGETVSWVQSGTGGTLTVKDGAKTAHLALIGTYTSSSFKLTDDGHGGTFVADPPPQAPAAAFVQAIAGLASDRGGFAGVHGGGTAVISAPLFVTPATSGR